MKDLINKSFIPINKNLLIEEVELIEEKENVEKDLIALPENYKSKNKNIKSHLKLYKVLEVAVDCSSNFRSSAKGKYVVADVSMVEQLTFLGKQYTIINEVYVRGMFLDVVR